jgi:Mrp family chromosome partitioning ATPase
VEIETDQLRRRLPSAKQVASDLYGVKWKNDRATCPRAENHAHGDRDPSFVFLPKKNRLKCFSKLCFGEKAIDVFDFVGQMERCDFQGAARILAQTYDAHTGSPSSNGRKTPHAKRRSSSRKRLESEGWLEAAKYSMGEGMRKVRFEHPGHLQTAKNRPEKTFIWEHQGDNGTWKPGRNERQYQAYVNEPFRERDQVESALGVESERSADAVGNFGIPAFSFKELTADNAGAFAGLDLRLLRDKDADGEKLLRRVIELLHPHARSIGLIEPPADWLEAGDIYDAITDKAWDQGRLESLMATAQAFEPKNSEREKEASAELPKIWTLSSLRTATFEPPEPIVEHVIAQGETICLVGKPKAGKSRLTQQMALAVSRGESFLAQAVRKARRVLILDLENRAAGVRSRFQKMSQASPGDDRLFIYAPETLSDLGVTLATAAGMKALQRLVAHVKPDVLIIDTWRLWLSGDENKTEVVVRGLRALSSLRQLLPTLAIVIVHHSRKTQGQDPPLLRIDPSAWVENASGHNALIAHVDACFGLEREIDRKTGDELIVFGGVSRSAATTTLLLDEDPDALTFSTAENADVVQKLLTHKEREAWRAVEDLSEFKFGDVVERAQTKNRKLVASLLRKLVSMKVIERGGDGLYRRLKDKRN